MTTLYKPVQIESAEQAEALPIGTVATLSEDIGDGVADFYAAAKVEDGWERTDSAGPSWMNPTPGAGMVGWTALVPIEAEEEFQDIDAYEASGHMRRHHLARYVTPWEEA